MFSLEGNPRRLRDPSSSHPENNVFLGPRAVSLGQNWTAQIKSFERIVFGEISKKLYFKIFDRAILDLNIHCSPFKDKTPGRKCITVFEFLQRPKVNSTITVPIIKYEKRHVPCYVRETSIPHKRYHPRLQKSAELPLKPQKVYIFVHAFVHRYLVCERIISVPRIRGLRLNYWRPLAVLDTGRNKKFYSYQSEEGRLNW